MRTTAPRRLAALSRQSRASRRPPCYWKSLVSVNSSRRQSSVIRRVNFEKDDDSVASTGEQQSGMSILPRHVTLPSPQVPITPPTECKDIKDPSSAAGGNVGKQIPQRVVVRSQPSPRGLLYTGDHDIPITSTLHIVAPEKDTPTGVWPIFRIMDEDGHFRDPTCDGYQPRDNEYLEYHKTPPVPAEKFFAPSPEVDDLEGLRSWLVAQHPFHEGEVEMCSLLRPTTHEFPDMASKNPLLRAHGQMLRLKEMDSILQNAQRQGRIPFYMSCRGEEAIHMGAASALDLGDVILAQYREAGLLMWRGFTLEQFTNQCFSTDLDLGKGRQMPVHYGSRALNYQTISSPLGTQLPQAVGAAYRLKLQKKPNVAVCFFGDGCASTTDFHSALNFAATLETPVVFVCRNNGYAISTPVTDQYRGDGIVSRAPGYGMAGLRVDGNDLFAMHAAIREAKAYALQHSAPVLLEAMTYRQGHHSTSDDSTRYRSTKEVQDHSIKGDPIVRVNSFLKNIEWIDDDTVHSIRNEEKLAVMKAVEQAENRSRPQLEDLFEDVYHEVPQHLRWQEEELKAHIAKYPEKYRSDKHH